MNLNPPLWQQFLSRPWSIAALALLGLLMALPTVNVGLIGDDFLFRELIMGKAHHAPPGSFFGLFTFADGQPAHIQALKDVGQFPWWVADNALMSFWRPLSELTHWLDYQLWPDSPVLMHVHSMLWYGLLMCLLGRLYRTLDPHALRGGLATLIFVLSSTHLFTVTWLAARNQLIAGCFVLITTMLYHRWRQGQGRRYGLWALLALATGLLSAEAAVAAMAYLVAYALAFEQGKPWWPRLRALLPFLAVVVAWRLVYQHLGYGSGGGGGYIDPGADPLRFGQAMLLRLPSLLVAELYGVSSSVLHLLPYPTQLLYATGAAGVLLITFWAGQYVDLWSTRLARFFGLGAVLALVPVCAAESNDRLLLNAEFGLSAVLAMLFVRMVGRRHDYQGVGAWGAKFVVGALMLVHLLIFPIATAGFSLAMRDLILVPSHDEPTSLPDAGPDSRDQVLLVNPPQALFVGYYPVTRRYFGFHNASSMQALASGNQALTLTVLGERTVRMSAPLGFGEEVSRDFLKHPFKVGDQVRTGRFTVTIEDVLASSHKPRTVRFDFDTPLQAAPWRLYQWGDRGYEPFTLPAVGQSVTLPAVSVGKLVAQRIKSSLCAVMPHGVSRCQG